MPGEPNHASCHHFNLLALVLHRDGTVAVKNNGCAEAVDVTVENLTGITIPHHGVRATWVESWQSISAGAVVRMGRRVEDAEAHGPLRFLVGYNAVRYERVAHVVRPRRSDRRGLPEPGGAEPPEYGRLSLFIAGDGTVMVRNDADEEVVSITVENLDGLTVERDGARIPWAESWESIPAGEAVTMARRMRRDEEIALGFLVSYDEVRYPQAAYIAEAQ